jgi:hypothetical protein
MMAGLAVMTVLGMGFWQRGGRCGCRDAMKCSR